MSPVQRTLIIIGLVVLAIGLAWPWLSKLGLFRLPGDIHLKGESWSVHFPLMTSLILSVVLSLILWLTRR